MGRNRYSVNVNLDKVRTLIGDERPPSVARKIGVCDMTVRAMLSCGFAQRQTLYKFCLAYNADYLNLISTEGSIKMSTRKKMPVNVGYIRQKLGTDSMITAAYKMGLSDFTVRRMVYNAEATSETILRFCKAYNAEYEQAVAKLYMPNKTRQENDSNRDKTNNADTVSKEVMDAFTTMSMKIDALTGAVTALAEAVGNLNDIRTDVAACKAQLVALNDLAKSTTESQLNFMDHSRRCHNGIYSFLKKLNEPTA